MHHTNPYKFGKIMLNWKIKEYQYVKLVKTFKLNDRMVVATHMNSTMPIIK